MLTTHKDYRSLNDRNWPTAELHVAKFLALKRTIVNNDFGRVATVISLKRLQTWMAGIKIGFLKLANNRYLSKFSVTLLEKCSKPANLFAY